MALPTPSSLGFGSPIAPLVLTHVLIGPNASSSETSEVSRQACTRPMKDNLGVGKVLPIGVRQQPAYQRKSPLGVRRRQASAPRPSVKRRFLGSTWTMSD